MRTALYCSIVTLFVSACAAEVDGASEESTASTLTREQCKATVASVEASISQFRKTGAANIANALDAQFASSAFRFDRTQRALVLREDFRITLSRVSAAEALMETMTTAQIEGEIQRATELAICESVTPGGGTTGREALAAAFFARLATK